MWYIHAIRRKSIMHIHPSIQCRFTHFCPSDALESTQIGPKLSEKLSSLWWERKWRSRVMQAPIDCFRKLINFSQYIMTRKLSRTPQKCSTSKARQIPPASLTGISLIPSETCFRPVREAGYESTSVYEPPSSAPRKHSRYAPRKTRTWRAATLEWLEQNREPHHELRQRRCRQAIIYEGRGWKQHVVS